jgi:2'-5' RNA ligase
VPAPETFRLFIALPVPDDIKEKLRCAQAEIRSGLRADPVRWVRPEQIHLTLKFLGNVPVARTDELVESVRAACISVEPLQLTAGKIGFFPNAHQPRVIWADIAGETELLERLQSQIERATSTFADAQKDHRFSAHLTIGRIKEIRPADARALEQAASEFTETVFGNWTAATVEIMRSELASDGSRYTRIAEIPLHSAAKL